MAALPFFPFTPPTANGGGRWERWYYQQDSTVLNGSHIEQKFQPTVFSIKINGTVLTAGSESGNPSDPWSSELCAALVSEAKHSIVVRDNDSSGVHIHNGTHGGPYTQGTRSNLTITATTT